MKPGIVVRPWERGDIQLLAEAGPKLSARTLQMRFWTPVPALPAIYLKRVEQRWPACWDGVVAIEEGALVGWAEFGRHPGDDLRADIGVCVIDAEQGRGVGTALLTAVLEQARGAGLVSVHADMDPYNRPARHAWLTVTGASASTFALAG
jgi:RimJ/RimL family protein N-acetyltransferase